MGTAELTYVEPLYVGARALPHRERILQAVSIRKPLPGVYLITFASNGIDQLDVVPLYMACLQMKKHGLPMLAGIALGREDAFATVERIAADAYRETGACHLQSFLLQRRREGAGI